MAFMKIGEGTVEVFLRPHMKIRLRAYRRHLTICGRVRPDEVCAIRHEMHRLAGCPGNEASQSVMLHVCWSGREHDCVWIKRVPVPLSPQYIHHKRPWKWTQVSAVTSQALHVVCQFWPLRNLAQHAPEHCSVAKWRQPGVCCFVRQSKWNASRLPFENSPAKNQQMTCIRLGHCAGT